MVRPAAVVMAAMSEDDLVAAGNCRHAGPDAGVLVGSLC
jgi:hypothetical protein